MNTQTQEALKMAIEAIENLCEAFMLGADWKGIVVYDGAVDALAACNEALEQPAQEPVAWEDKEDKWSADIEKAHPVNSKAYADWDVAQRMVSNRHSKNALIALVCWLLQKDTRPEQPLSDEAIMFMYSEPCSDKEIIEFARAIEQAHGIGVKGE